MRDMSPRTDRSIRNIPVAAAKRRATRLEPEAYEEEEEVAQTRRPKRRRGGSRLFIVSAVIVAVICGAGGLLLSTLFSGASVVVHPRSAAITAPVTISAQPNAPAGVLPYQTMTLTSNGTTSIAAAGSQKVSRQASGVMTITNNFGTESQRLIANTRFEAPDGKIYRIHESVVVPGMTGSTPGTATITVYADSPGEAYNRGATHFTVPGFKSDPRYTKFYADAASISGGFVGNEPAVAANDLAAAKTAMQQKLEESVRSSFAAQVPEGFLPVENSFQFSFSDMRQIPDGANKATLSQSVTAVAAVVRASDLAAATAVQAAEGYAGEAVAFKDVSAVHVVMSPSSKGPVGKMDIVVQAPTTVVWQYDKGALKTALIGKKKDTFEAIITSFRPALVGAELTLRPFWQSNLPSNPDKITITEGALK